LDEFAHIRQMSLETLGSPVIDIPGKENFYFRVDQYCKKILFRKLFDSSPFPVLRDSDS